MIFAAAFPLLLAVAPLSVDKAAHSVTFTAKATDIAPNTTVEFAFVGPNSDRAYEALFVTDASVKDIAKAFDEAGIPRGRAVSPSACRFWPAGKRVTIEPSPWDFIAKGAMAEGWKCGKDVVYTGGRRDASGLPFAETNMPSAVFAMYSLDQSLMLLTDAADQSQAYGKFVSNDKFKSGERRTFKVSWDGKSGTESRRLEIRPGNLKESIASLKGAATDLDVLVDFSPELTAAEARAAASALAVLDSPLVKVNGFSDGRFFYRAFLPDEQWRDRHKRLTQPLELHLAGTNLVCTVVDEDWSVEGIDPKLTPHDEKFADLPAKFKGDSCLVYVRADEKLARLYALKKQLPKTICNWYVFID